MKRPAFQFYPADWRKDAALQSCSVGAQGLWINALCIAHECEPYGHLTVNGKAMTPAQIGRLVGLSAKECTALLTELQEAGVSSVAADGAVFSRRMVRDEEFRETRATHGEKGKAFGHLGKEFGHLGAEHGVKGGRPRRSDGGIKPPPPDDYTGGSQPPPHNGYTGGLNPPQTLPPSSSSSSSEKKTPLPPEGVRRRPKNGHAPEGFAEFYAKYPRKVARADAEKAWSKIDPDEVLRGRIMAALQSNGFDYREEGRFIPHPATWLNAARWDDEPMLELEGVAEQVNRV